MIVWNEKLGYDLALDFGFCRVNIFDKNLSFVFSQEFTSELNDISFENKVQTKIYILSLKLLVEKICDTDIKFLEEHISRQVEI